MGRMYYFQNPVETASDIAYASLSYAVRCGPSLWKTPVLDYDGVTPSVSPLVQPDDGLRVVMQCVSAKELHAPSIDVGVDLRCDHDRYFELPGHTQQNLRLTDELVPDSTVIMIETVKHGQ